MDPILTDLPESRTWPDRPTAAEIAALPSTPALCLFIDASGNPIQLASTQHLRRFAESRLIAAVGEEAKSAQESESVESAVAPENAGSEIAAAPVDAESESAAAPEDIHTSSIQVPSAIAPTPTAPLSPRADLGEIVRGVRWREVTSPFEARWRYFLLAKRLYPRDYRKLIAFGPAWFLNLDPSQPVPEIRLTDRIWNAPGRFIGPWPDRQSCQKALEGLWDLFELCRYPEQVRKAPLGKRCAYADMGRCDAPCDGSAEMHIYRNRIAEAWSFASNGSVEDGGSSSSTSVTAGAPSSIARWIAAARDRMTAAAALQQFERAAMIKQQLAFAAHWQSAWSPRITTDNRLEYLLAIPVTRRRKWKLFLFRRGRLTEGPMLSDKQLPVDGPAWLQTAYANADPSVASGDSTDAILRMEQTWLISHFLNHADAQASVIANLRDFHPTGDGDLARWLAEQLAERRRIPEVLDPRP